MFYTNLPSKVAQAFQPVQAQAEAYGYKNCPLIATQYKLIRLGITPASVIR